MAVKPTYDETAAWAESFLSTREVQIFRCYFFFKIKKKKNDYWLGLDYPSAWITSVHNRQVFVKFDIREFHKLTFVIIMIIIIIIIYLSWSSVTCWPVPVSRIQKPLRRSTMIPSASWTVVFHYPGQSISRHSLKWCIQLLLYSSNLSKICVIFSSFAICAFILYYLCDP